MTLRPVAAVVCLAGLAWAAGCESSAREQAGTGRSPRTAVAVYVSNERSNDISVIDHAKREVVTTIPVGKRPRGILVSRDKQTVYVALSGSPIGDPHVKDQDLQPADKKADGIAMVDAHGGRFLGKINSGSGPE